MNPAEIIASELTVAPRQVAAAISLLDEGSTVPFIARYRKEVTGGLDDTQLRTLDTRLTYLRELQDRRESVLATIEQQGKRTPQLKKMLVAAYRKTELEYLYLPYKQKRRTKAQIAREAGLQPLADLLLEDHRCDPLQQAQKFINAQHNIENAEQALDGARQILMEQIAEMPEFAGPLREQFWQRAHLSSKVVKDKVEAGAKYSDYFDYSESIEKVPSHRALALLRGQNEGILRLTTELPELDDSRPHPFVTHIAGKLKVPGDATWQHNTIRMCWRVKLHTRFESDLRTRLRENAETAAIAVFASNLRDLLLAAPAGPKVTIGLDPGLRTGVKVAVTSATGKLLDTHTIYPHPPQKRYDESIADIARLAKKHNAELIAIGNG
ncbi:MAG: Tex-like N-terminal domain-containing protein, partial [Pseudomonadota bacterium]